MAEYPCVFLLYCHGHGNKQPAIQIRASARAVYCHGHGNRPPAIQIKASAHAVYCHGHGNRQPAIQIKALTHAVYCRGQGNRRPAIQIRAVNASFVSNGVAVRSEALIYGGRAPPISTASLARINRVCWSFAPGWINECSGITPEHFTYSDYGIIW